MSFSILVIHNKIEGRTSLCIPRRPSLKSDLDSFFNIITSPPPATGNFSGDADGFRSGFTRPDYIHAINRIKEYIASGHVYQVNLSQRFEMGFTGDTFNLFCRLYQDNPAPFFAYIHAGDHQIVSTSPERFILRVGDRIETRPIKGTRPRANMPEQDEQLGRELMQSKKDEAELSMIVDLLRNDLGKVCMAGSVQVAQHKRLEVYQNVYHLVSIVEGKLDPRFDSVDLITATFPGGSITGCPKIRSMEIIDELEPVRRHIYTGCIGYIGFHDTMDLSIAIRTATVYNDKILFSVGGGIVFDSNPQDEFDETLHKGQTLMQVFKGDERRLSKLDKNIVWINGRIEPQERASVPVTDLGLQYGYGFFETLLVENGDPEYLKEHIERFNKTWRQLFFDQPPDLSWGEIIRQVISRNGLEEVKAALKIIATNGDSLDPPLNHSIIVMARPYIHRLTDKNVSETTTGLRLATYPEPRQSPLANHKTLNYLYYLLAGKWAQSKGADEALILNPDGSVSETNTANILLIQNRTIIVPASPAVLPGIMQQVVCRGFMDRGFQIERKRVLPEDLFAADRVLITNSLIGAVPMISLDGAAMETSTPKYSSAHTS